MNGNARCIVKILDWRSPPLRQSREPSLTNPSRPAPSPFPLSPPVRCPQPRTPRRPAGPQPERLQPRSSPLIHRLCVHRDLIPVDGHPARVHLPPASPHPHHRRSDENDAADGDGERDGDARVEPAVTARGNRRGNTSGFPRRPPTTPPRPGRGTAPRRRRHRAPHPRRRDVHDARAEPPCGHRDGDVSPPEASAGGRRGSLREIESAPRLSRGPRVPRAVRRRRRKAR